MTGSPKSRSKNWISHSRSEDEIPQSCPKDHMPNPNKKLDHRFRVKRSSNLDLEIRSPKPGEKSGSHIHGQKTIPPKHILKTRHENWDHPTWSESQIRQILSSMYQLFLLRRSDPVIQARKMDHPLLARRPNPTIYTKRPDPPIQDRKLHNQKNTPQSQSQSRTENWITHPNLSQRPDPSINDPMTKIRHSTLNNWISESMFENWITHYYSDDKTSQSSPNNRIPQSMFKNWMTHSWSDEKFPQSSPNKRTSQSMFEKRITLSWAD